MLLTTQYMEEAEHLANAIVVLDAGKVVAEGTADELKDRMGGDAMEVTVTNRADLERAASLIADLGSAPPRVDPELKQIRLATGGGTKVLIAAGRRLDDSGIALNDLAIRRPSLDDVFLAITGHRTDSAAAKESS